MENSQGVFWDIFCTLAEFYDVSIGQQPDVEKTSAQYRLLKQEITAKVASAPTTQKIVKHSRKTETSQMLIESTDLVLGYSPNGLELTFNLEGISRRLIPRPFGSEVTPSVVWYRPTAVVIGLGYAFCENYIIGSTYYHKFPGRLPKLGPNRVEFSKDLYGLPMEKPLCHYVTYNNMCHALRVGQHEDLTHLPPPGPFGYADPVFARPLLLREVILSFMDGESKVYIRECELLGMSLPKNFVVLNSGQFTKDRVQGTPIVAVNYGKSTDFHQRALLEPGEEILLNSPFLKSLASNSHFITSGCKAVVEMSFNPYIPSGFHSCSSDCPLASIMAGVLMRVFKGFTLAFSRYPRPHDSGVLVIATPGPSDLNFVVKTINSVIFKSALSNAARGVAEGTGVLAFETSKTFIMTRHGCCGKLGNVLQPLGYVRASKEKAKSRKKKAEVDGGDYGGIFSPVGEK